MFADVQQFVALKHVTSEVSSKFVALGALQCILHHVIDAGKNKKLYDSIVICEQKKFGALIAQHTTDILSVQLIPVGGLPVYGDTPAPVMPTSKLDLGVSLHALM